MTKHTTYRIFLSLAFALCTCHISAQSLRSLLRPPTDVIAPKWERTPQGTQEFSYYNTDYCEYHLYRKGDRSYNLRMGKTTVFSKAKDSKVDNPFNSPSTYRYYRGQFPKAFQISTPYALPVKQGNTTSWQTNRHEPYKTMNFRIEKGDTIYATRSGIACKNTHTQHLLIYHADKTFAAYLAMNRNFIQPGEEVQVGQPIGLAGSTGLSISYFFLDPHKFSETPPAGHPYSHFVPTFRTSEGDIRIEEQTDYRCVIDDALMMQDMNKRSQKKYSKKK